MNQNPSDKPLPRTRSKPIIVFSEIASLVFHPLFMTAITAVILYRMKPDVWPNKNWLGSLILCTIVLPFAAIFLFKITGVISNARMHTPKDRVFPLAATLVFYFVAFKILGSWYHLPVVMKSLLLGSCFSIAMILVINFFYKVSVHTTSAVILTGVTIVLNVALKWTTPLLLPFAVFIGVLVGIIRWSLGAHTLGQILLGYVVGIFSQVAGFFLLTHNTFLARILLLS